jgi:formylglycine-generating enzyme required for sulfatase activity
MWVSKRKWNGPHVRSPSRINDASTHVHVTSARPIIGGDMRRPGAKRRSGRPGSLPSRGSHGSGRAEFPHPALRGTVFAARHGRTHGGGSGYRCSNRRIAVGGSPRCERWRSQCHHAQTTRYRKPITCINWAEAYAFCIWDGGFLPSEAEWLYAAEGGAEQRVYPWGANDPGTLNQYAIYGCHYPDGSGVCGPLFNNLAPVGTATLGAGRWGQLDLAGGVLQWVLDLMQPRPGGYMVDPCVDCGSVVSPFGDEQGDITSRIYWGSTFHSAPATLYQGWATYGWATLNRVFDIGFRCARSP